MAEPNLSKMAEIESPVAAGAENTFEIIGKKKEPNTIEDFWMDKLTSLEKQYENEMIQMERSLLDNRFHKRVVLSHKEKIDFLKEELTEKRGRIQELQTKSEKLEKNLKTELEKSNRLKRKLVKTEPVLQDIKGNLLKERNEKLGAQKEVSNLKKKLEMVEKEKKYLNQDIETRDEEKAALVHMGESLEKDRKLKTLLQMNQGLKTQTMSNLKMNEELAHLLNLSNSQERKLLELRRDLEESCETIRKIKAENSNFQRKDEISKKKLTFADEKLTKFEEKLKESDRQKSHWKEESHWKNLEFLEISKSSESAVGENTKLRSKLANLNYNLQYVRKELAALQTQQQRLDRELIKSKGQQKALGKVSFKNSQEHDKIVNNLESSAGNRLPDNNRTGSLSKYLNVGSGIVSSASSNSKRKIFTATPRFCQSKERHEAEAYNKKIWSLERQIEELQKSMDNFKRKENIFKYRLQRLKKIEQQNLLNERALLSIDLEKKNLERLTYSFTQKVPPRKMPLEKLVTDPSLLDKITKQRILIQRLFKQTEKVTEAKKICETLINYQRPTFSSSQVKKPRDKSVQNGGHTDASSSNSPWSLKFWRQDEDEELLKDFLEKLSIPEITSYKKSIQELESEIPILRNDIFQLEKKKDYITQERLKQLDDSSTRGKKSNMSRSPPVKNLYDDEDLSLLVNYESEPSSRGSSADEDENLQYLLNNDDNDDNGNDNEKNQEIQSETTNKE